MFLSVITRTYKRPKMFKANRQALKMQTCQDYEEIILKDMKGVGVQETHKKFHTLDVRGDYVFVYDDDVVLLDDTFFQKAKELIEDLHPGVVIVKSLVVNLIFPDKWPIEKGHIDTANFIVSRDIWLKHRTDWKVVPKEEGGEGGDFAFIDAVLKDDPVVAWLDIVATKTIRVSKGSPEEWNFELPADVLARNTVEIIAKAIKERNTLKVGDKIQTIASHGNQYAMYSPSDAPIAVTKENIDMLESFVRGGLAQKV